jgi:hypothetical protein
MQTAPSHVSALPRESSILLRILPTYLVLAVSSIALSYLSGAFSFNLYWMVTSWISAAIQAFVLEYSRDLSVPRRKGFAFQIFFTIPAVTQLVQDFALTDRFDLRQYNFLVFLVMWIVRTGALIVGVWLLHSAYKFRASSLNDLQPAPENPTVAINDLQSRNADPTTLLGRGNDYVDRVIHSVVSRSSQSERMASFSLVVMLVLVLIGGMASFGLWAFTHADRISSI